MPCQETIRNKFQTKLYIHRLSSKQLEECDYRIFDMLNVSVTQGMIYEYSVRIFILIYNCGSL